MNFAEDPFQYGYVLQVKVSFKMGLFLDTQHTLPGIFILESPPPGSSSHLLSPFILQDYRSLRVP